MRFTLITGICFLVILLLAGCIAAPPAPPPATSPTKQPVTPGPSPATPAMTATITPEPTPSPTASVPPPIAGFTSNTTTGKAPLTVRFTDTSTGDPTGWNWSFGDGNTSDERNPAHTYTVPGSYPVRLRTTNSGGTNNETKVNYITVNPAYTQPAASFSADPPTFAQPFTVQFHDRSTGLPTSWSWNFGDGGTSGEQNPVHTYPGNGTFIVTLEVSNPAGSTETTGFVILGG